MPIDQLKMPRTIPGLGDNLLTVSPILAGVARVRCQVCGVDEHGADRTAVGCRVVAGTVGGNLDTIAQFDFQFWLTHFAINHPEKLPKEIMEEM